MKIAYSPFDDDDTVSLISYNISKFHAWTPLEKFDKRVRRHKGANSQPLKDVKYSQQLYVFGHGAPRATEIDDCSGNSISIDTLASRLFFDGLSMSHEVIKLHSCSGGVGGKDSMAAQLKDKLQAIGFTKIKVYGYVEDLSTTTSGVIGSKRGHASGARAKDIRVQF